MKPWHYEYNPVTCELVETDTVSPHLLQLWWDIFLSFVQPRLTGYMPGLVGQLAMLQVHQVTSIYFNNDGDGDDDDDDDDDSNKQTNSF